MAIKSKLQVGLKLFPFSVVGSVVCPTCHKRFTDKQEKEFIKRFGECSGCEHVRGEVLDSQKVEVEELFNNDENEE